MSLKQDPFLSWDLWAWLNMFLEQVLGSSLDKSPISGRKRLSFLTCGVCNISLLFCFSMGFPNQPGLSTSKKVSQVPVKIRKSQTPHFSPLPILKPPHVTQFRLSLLQYLLVVSVISTLPSQTRPHICSNHLCYSFILLSGTESKPSCLFPLPRPSVTWSAHTDITFLPHSLPS